MLKSLLRFVLYLNVYKSRGEPLYVTNQTVPLLCSHFLIRKEELAAQNSLIIFIYTYVYEGALLVDIQFPTRR